MPKQSDQIHLQQLSELLGQKLTAKNWRIACAESCSGGLLAKTLTDVSGSSAYFDRAIVAYSNDAKQQMLGVDVGSLIQYGAVSEEVVKQMAIGIMKLSQADVVMAITGITGPNGGTIEKPVGTVWFGGLAKNGQVYTLCRHFIGDRQEIRTQTVIAAIEILLAKFI